MCFTLLDKVLPVLDLFTATESRWLLVSTEESAGPGNVLRFNLTKFQFEETHEHKASWLH